MRSTMRTTHCGPMKLKFVKRGSPIGELPPPRNLGSRFTTMSGRVALKWDREEGAEMHRVFMSTSNNPFNWVLIGATAKSRFNADSLKQAPSIGSL